MSVSKVGPAADYLRTATRDLHDAVEATEPVRRLMAGPLDRDVYAGILTRFLAAQRAEEAAVRVTLDPADPAVAALDGVHRLSADLSALGVVPAEGPPATGAESRSGDADPTAALEREAIALGRLWCLWGAHRGGPAVVAALARHLPGAPTQFFRPTERDRERHTALLQRIAAIGPEACLPGAQAAFDGFCHAFSAASAGEAGLDRAVGAVGAGGVSN